MANNNQRFQGCCPLTPIPKPPKQKCVCPPGPRGPRGPQGEQGPPGPPVPQPLCPPITQPNEPPECDERRDAYQANNPYFRFDLNLQYYFFNNQADFVGATNACEGLGADYRFLTVEELAAIDLTVNGQPLCPMLVWATINGNPTLAYVIPVQGGPNVIIPVPTPSIFCRANTFCGITLE